MSPALQLLLLAALTCSSSFGASDHRIVGGIDANPNEFPYQVSLRRKGNHFCGGSIISDQWILTAAHCVEGQNEEDFTIVAGSNLLDSGGVKYAVKKFIPHSSYESSTISNDIALIELKDSIETNESIQKIELSTTDTPAGTELVLSGWGTTTYPGKIPNKLQTLKLLAISNDDCSTKHPRSEITKGNICTFTKAGEGACHGDSGGPLVASGKQVGVVSWGIPCAKGKPDVFTRVYSYLDWIAEHTK